MSNKENKGEILIYRSDDGRIKLDVKLENETLWMTQADMALLFGCSTDNISLHLKNIYEGAELEEATTTEDYSVVRQEGSRNVSRALKHSLYSARFRTNCIMR